MSYLEVYKLRPGEAWIRISKVIKKKKEAGVSFASLFRWVFET